MTPMQQMAEYAAQGKLVLQHCAACGIAQYPPRELCAACLADRLEWRVSDAEYGQVIAHTTLHHSHEPAWQLSLPLPVALVRLDVGVTIICFISEGCEIGTSVRVTAHNDAAGQVMLTAAPT